MKTVFFTPPLKKVSGGLATIYHVASNLQSLGYEVAITGLAGSSPPVGLEAWSNLSFIPAEKSLTKNDFFCIPESWPNSLAMATKVQARSLVYCQNWVYLLGLLPENVQWKDLPLTFFSVSSPVSWFMKKVLGVAANDIISPVVTSHFFCSANRPSTHIKVAWMPRKNRGLGIQVQQVVQECLAQKTTSPRVEWVTINNMPTEQVAETLSTCHIFLSTGFPEGFGLPPLEAMASGCIPVGFTGFGGWEYMRQAEQGYTPEGFSLEAKPYAGNGWFSADGDTISAGITLARVIEEAWKHSSLWAKTIEAAKATALLYTNDAQCGTLSRVWSQLMTTK